MIWNKLMNALKDVLTFNVYRFPRLFTHEDAAYFHTHKLMGAFCLAHYVVRVGLFMMYGSSFFERDWSSVATLLPHFLLHVSSFEFHLSTRRNHTYNVIWPEFRWHSMIFAYRSLLTMLAVIYLPDWMHRVVRSAIVMVTLVTADAATHYYKKRNLLESNDSTMRGNPYPKYAPEAFKRSLNLFYSVSQVFATMTMLCRAPDLIFMTLIPIQTASLLMTLVRKGFITQAGWHLYYFLGLGLNYVAVLKIRATGNSILSGCVLGFCVLRFGFRVNKYVLWGLINSILIVKGAPMVENMC